MNSINLEKYVTQFYLRIEIIYLVDALAKIQKALYPILDIFTSKLPPF